MKVYCTVHMLGLLQIPLRMSSYFHYWLKVTFQPLFKDIGEKSAFWEGGFSVNVQGFHLGLWPGLLFSRRGSILAWIVILSVYGADTIAIDLSLAALISWFMKSIIGFLNNSNLHAIFSPLLIINLH